MNIKLLFDVRLVILLGLVFLHQTEIPAQEKSINFYGYAQLDFETSDKADFISTFKQRRLNLITDYSLDAQTRVLADLEYEDNLQLDAAGKNNSGSIKISRFWVEYTVRPYLKLRAGKMLTPFGLYNLVHDASVSYYAVDPPLLYVEHSLGLLFTPQRFFSKYSIGFEASGTLELDEKGSQIEYYTGLANGRGITPDGTDANQNKAVYGRLMYRPAAVFGLQFGTSFYIDKNVDGILNVRNDYEPAAAVDLQYENSNLQIQAEGLVSWYTTPDGIRDHAMISYIQLAYTVWGSLTPFVNYSIIDISSKNEIHNFLRINAGLNWAMTSSLFLKSEIQFHSSEENQIQGAITFFKASIAVAF